MSDEREMLAEVLAGVLGWHLTEQTYESGCVLACGYDGDDMGRHLADALLASPQFARLIAAAKGEALREAAEAVEKHRDLVSRLGFGDNITEPMADNDTIVHWFEQQGLDANEWIESQLWRNDCYAAGHPDDEDCWEHDPILQAEQRGAERVRAAIEGVIASEGQQHIGGHRWIRDDWLRAALTAEPVATEGEGA